MTDRPAPRAGTTPPVILVPGAWTSVSAFDDVRDALECGGHQTDVVDLPARASRVAQLDRGGLSAIDAVLDWQIERCERHPC